MNDDYKARCVVGKKIPNFTPPALAVLDALKHNTTLTELHSHSTCASNLCDPRFTIHDS